MPASPSEPTSAQRFAWAASLTVIGTLVAFFFVFNTLFTDGPADHLDSEYLVAYLLVLVTYGVPAFVAGRWGPDPWWGNAVPLAVPGLVVLVFTTDASWDLRLLILLAGVLGGAAGSVTGRRLRVQV